MNMWMAFVSIIAIVAIVLVAGGLIALIGHMIIGAFDNEKRTSNKEVIDYNQYKQIENSNSQKKEEYDFEAINQAKVEREQALISKEEENDIFKLIEDEDEDIEEIEKRLKQANEAKEENVEVVEEKVEVKPEETAQPAVNDDVDDLDLDSMLDEISKDIIEEQKESNKEEEAPKMSEQLNSYNIDEILAHANDEDDEDEGDEQPEDEQPEGEEPLEIRVEEKEEKDTRLENANQEIKDLKAQLAELNQKLDQARNSKVEIVTINSTEEECVARLEVLEERLKNVKKDYKTNMKEYRPLKKIMNDLEKYQTKLRRKENIVAKKKVALYGVNNYVDLDKEKAEKLAKEIELWEGLRLSVSHCEDVINANKDRYPILEHTNKILEDQIASLEADIASTQATLNKIREQNGEGSKDGESQQ